MSICPLPLPLLVAAEVVVVVVVSMLLVPQRVAAVAPPCVSCPQHVQQAVTVCLDLPTAWHPEGMHKPMVVGDSQ